MKKTIFIIIPILCLYFLTIVFADNLPKTDILDKIANIYESVKFSHENHTRTVGDCVKCHHTGTIISCNKCHLTPVSNDIPGLKDVYHRQCIGCHQNTQGLTGCTDCHAKKKVKKKEVKKEDVTEIKLEKGPETCVLSSLTKQYKPVTFSHKRHTDIIGDCAKCHHSYSGTGEPQECKKCHQRPFDPKNLNMPGLKGAYHRRCLNCHKEMKGKVGCTQCHEKMR